MKTTQTVNIADLKAELTDKQKQYGKTFNTRNLRVLADEIESLQIKINRYAKAIHH